MRVFSAITLGLIISLFFYLTFGTSNITALVIARTIPRYPNATWALDGSGGFTDAMPGASVHSKTDATRESVFRFYKVELGKKGWKLVKDQDSPMDNRISFEKDFKRGTKTIKAEITITGFQSISEKVRNVTKDLGDFWAELTYKTYDVSD